MANWKTDVTTSNFNSTQALNDITQGRQRTEDFSKFGGFESMGEVLGSGITGQHQTLNTSFGNSPLGHLEAGWNWLTGDGFTKTTGYDIVGISATQIGPMRDAINTYVQNVETYLNNVLEDEKDAAHDAFRGEDAEREVKAYLDKVHTYIINLTPTLLAFSDKLADVGNAWIDAQQNIGTNVNSSAGAFSEGTKYQESVTYKG